MKGALNKTPKNELVIPDKIDLRERYNCGLAQLHFFDPDGNEGFLLYGDTKEIYQTLYYWQMIKNNVEKVLDFCRKMDDSKITSEDLMCLNAITKTLHYIITEDEKVFQNGIL